MRHAAEVHAVAGAGSAASFESPPRSGPGSQPAVYEMRTYQLHPGYGNVPAVLKAFQSGYAKPAVTYHLLTSINMSLQLL